MQIEMGVHHEHTISPCLHCEPQSYIAMVQNLIERCLCFHMSREDYVEALSNHASIQPIVTHTVWKELLKENKTFFQAYHHLISPSSSPPPIHLASYTSHEEEEIINNTNSLHLSTQ